ncbi:hypothetical protein NLG97_g10499 [Lecanicillium saksenae]|uniref:Uncharacterized protein n=1 Tax=Lecanicillium saksenae TaxID=468837 RepID=A0ACC1QD89_9HYPO|nr:hypothetical protein NLG97_g10499 [Lecanicillium saksenae]
MYGPDTGPDNRYSPLPAADAAGIGQRAEDISFYDINGDGKADYVWTRPIDGSVEVWLNMYPQMPAWNHVGVIASGVGTSGNNVRFAQLTGTKQTPGSGRADYIGVDPDTGSLSAWFNGCDNRA